MSSGTAKSIRDTVYDCLVAGAIGDALGAPIETMWWSEMREPYRQRLSELVVSRRDTVLIEKLNPNRVRINGRIILDKLMASWAEEISWAQ